MKRMVSEVGAEKLEQELNDLRTRGDDALKERWHVLYGTKPSPQKIHRSLLIAAIAHRMQENALGPLKSSVRHHLIKVANHPLTASPPPSYSSPRLRAGTVPVREWSL